MGAAPAALPLQGEPQLQLVLPTDHLFSSHFKLSQNQVSYLNTLIPLFSLCRRLSKLPVNFSNLQRDFCGFLKKSNLNEQNTGVLPSLPKVLQTLFDGNSGSCFKQTCVQLLCPQPAAL